MELMEMAEQCPEPRRACPFDGEARERIAVLEAEARHTRETLERMARNVEQITADLDKVSERFLEAMAQVRGGWWVLIQVSAIAVAVGAMLGAIGVKWVWK